MSEAGALRNTRSEGLELGELNTVCEVGVNPVKGCVSNTHGGGSIEEDEMRNGVENCTHIEKDEDGGETRTRYHEEAVCDLGEGGFSAAAETEGIVHRGCFG